MVDRGADAAQPMPEASPEQQHAHATAITID